MWKDAVVAYFKALSRNLSDETEGKPQPDKSKSGYPVYGLRPQSRTFE
jgi:hypothetical protein